MIRVRPKQLRLRLDSELYEQLRNEVLRRDGWRCQSCGTRSNWRSTTNSFAADPDTIAKKT